MAGSRAIDSQGDGAKARVYVKMAGEISIPAKKAKAGIDASVYQKTNATQALMDLRPQRPRTVKVTGQAQAWTLSWTRAGSTQSWNLEADDNATIYQANQSTQALTGSAVSRAVNSDGDRANTSVVASMNSGQFNNTQGVCLPGDENCQHLSLRPMLPRPLPAHQVPLLRTRAATLPTHLSIPPWPTACSYAIMSLEADGSAAIWQKTQCHAGNLRPGSHPRSKQGGRQSQHPAFGYNGPGDFNNTLLGEGSRW